MASRVGDAANGHADAPKRVSEPPLESSSAVWTRSFIIAAFWIVVVAFGLPHWYQTTSIHRSLLPLEAMNNWAEGKACQLDFPLNIRLMCPSVGEEKTTQLATEVQNLLVNDPQMSLYDVRVTPEEPDATIALDSLHTMEPADGSHGHQPESALTINVKADSSTKSTQSTLWSWAPVLDILHTPGRSADSATLAPFIAQEIRRVFENDQVSLSYRLEQAPFRSGRQAPALLPEFRANLDARNTRAFKYASTYHLTFSLFTSSAMPSAWDIEEALEETINPLLRRLSSISQFTVDTQVQLHASFSPSIEGPQYDDSTREWKLQRPDLSGFINAAEWPLSPGIGSGPTINFVLFVPSKDQSPLVLAETGGSSWIIPQWGGVQIHNPVGKQPQRLTSKDLQPVMLTFADQLSALLGLPQSPPSLSMRISSLTRERATSLIISASSTLGALSRLSLKLTSIAIPQSVSQSVDETIRRLDSACHDMRQGRYHSALAHARIAEEEAEKAFFEPSMVGQVYFPDEHKVAVYVPLLGPMAVPLVMALVKEIKSILKGLRGSRTRPKTD
jgi:GPI-anchor transamidase subunit S